ncbi:hypothetical protein AD951_07710 [Acetobacter malorum]|uniref:Actin homologue MreB-like C-terminal domain-containing protein n=1 Tax=Acetobacter malorum TaxID=178901 RepID=A0A149UN95_9PROT|nr:ParM/StbA family protein [Acetobacter malorum]KXV69216.1 hypothetical protein AD951_07710 [Acetobacter malorum]
MSEAMTKPVKRTKPAAAERVFVGIDDGHSEIKVAYFADGRAGEIKEFSFPSRVVDGYVEMDTDGGMPPNFYVLPDDASAAGGAIPPNAVTMTVLRRGQAGSTSGAGSIDPRYATSYRNRVLVKHALWLLAEQFPNATFDIRTTLPYSDFYKPGGGRNDALIEAKIANVARPAMRVRAEGTAATLVPEPFTLGSHVVQSEGLAAFFDLMLAYDPKGGLTPDAEFAARFEDDATGFLVVDVGGKTTDVVFGDWRMNEHPRLMPQKSRSLEYGVLGLSERFGLVVSAALDGVKVPDPESVLMSRRIRRFGASVDVGEHVDREAASYGKEIFSQIAQPLKEAETYLSAVVLVGGGSQVLGPTLREEFGKWAVLQPNEPRFANARGLLKLALAQAE